MCYTKIMKLFIRLNNLLNKAVYYIEFNILLLYSALFIIFCTCIYITGLITDMVLVFMTEIIIVFAKKYITVCGILLCIFLLNLLTFRRHLPVSKVPIWYNIIYKISFITNLIWIIVLIFLHFNGFI